MQSCWAQNVIFMTHVYKATIWNMAPKMHSDIKWNLLMLWLHIDEYVDPMLMWKVDNQFQLYGQV